MRLAFLLLFMFATVVTFGGCSDDDYGQDLGGNNNDMTVDVGTD